MEILCSKDYDQFSMYLPQRDLRPALVARIQKSMSKWGFNPTKPITVNKEGKIIDGQHRFQAAKNLGIAFYYVYETAPIPIEQIRQEADAARHWDLTDYVSSYVRQGNEEYKKLLMLKDLSGLNWDAFLASCFPEHYGGGSGNKRRGEAIRDGSVIVTERKEQAVLDYLSRLELFRDTFSGWRHRYFATACAHVFSHPKYDHEQMRRKLEQGMVSRLHKCVSVDDYISMLADIYNYMAKAQTRLEFSRGARGFRTQ